MRADRLISILMLLQTRGRLTAHDLAERLEVSERTIYRDLDALSTAGIPVYTERGPGGGCELLDSYRTNLTGMSEDELQALFMVSVPAPLADLGMSKALEAAQLKLSAALSASRRSGIEMVRQRIYLDSAAWFQPTESVPHLETLQRGLWHNRRVRIVYRTTDGSWGKRLIDPYGLVAKANIWYVVGYVIRWIQVYRVSRVQEAELTDSTFERPPDFDLPRFWAKWVREFESKQSQYPVTIRLASPAIPALPRIFGDSIWSVIEQTDPADDAGWVTLTLPFQSLEEARTHILGFGNQAEVLAPAELHQSIIGYATQILTAYTVDS